MERLCVLVISFIVLACANKDHLDYFEAAFGENSHLFRDSLGTKKHELFAVAHKHAVKRILKQDSDERPGHFLGCTDYKTADAAMSSLQQEYGQDNVHTVLSSKTDPLGIGGEQGLMCFVVQPDRITPSLLDAKSYLRVWLPVPPSMKVLSSAHDRLQTLLDAAKETSSRSVMDQLASSELEIHLGKASGQVAGRARSNDLAASLQERLKMQSRSAEARRNNLVSLSEMIPHVEAWQAVAAASHLRGAAPKGQVPRQLSEGKTTEGGTAEDCNFDKLVFSAHDEFLFITHMHELANPSCFASVVATAAHEPVVLSVDTPGEQYVPLLDLVGDLLHSGDPAEGRVYHDAGLTGAGVIVGLLDGGVDEYSCFFNNSDGQLVARSTLASPTHDLTRRKIIQYIFDEDSIEAKAAGHGTGMAGIICGEDTSGPHRSHFGVAPGAKIALYDASTSSGANIGPLGDALNTYYDGAITTGTKFYSASFGNRYTTYAARDVVNDQYAVDNDFLLIAAVGNWQNIIYNSTVYSPARSKNALSVGASGESGNSNVDILAYFSVTGPTHDGRFGVDVLAHGVDVTGPKSYGNSEGVTAESCEIYSRTGTSSSTAAVAGVAALVQEYFENSAFWAASCNQLYAYCAAGAATPKSILVKTLILHSGQDIGNSLAYPGNEQGFGRVQLNSVLLHSGVTPAGLDLYVTEAVLEKNTELQWTVTVTSNTLPLKVTIAWVDPANIVSATKQLLNDVDLQVVDEGGSVTYGNNNAAGDAHNNAEMVYIPSPTPGQYVVKVSIGLLGSGTTQNVSLVASSYGSVTASPEGFPSSEPTGEPSGEPSGVPSGEPSGEPTKKPTEFPTGEPSKPPSGEPSAVPSLRPTGEPTKPPSGEPSAVPSLPPTGEPSGIPTQVPTHQPNYNRPSARPFFAFAVPTVAPVPVPTPDPVATAAPVPVPTVASAPSDPKAPTFKPTISFNFTTSP